MSEDFDDLVIGAGMAGLSVAALLAKSGRRVLVLEGHDVPVRAEDEVPVPIGGARGRLAVEPFDLRWPEPLAEHVPEGLLPDGRQ